MKNLKEAKELLERYKNITLEQLEESYRNSPKSFGYKILNKITGFGETLSCTLCQSVRGDCDHCIYSFRSTEDDFCLHCVDIIYKQMSNAETAEKLFNAIQKRISYLTHVIEWYESFK